MLHTRRDSGARSIRNGYLRPRASSGKCSRATWCGEAVRNCSCRLQVSVAMRGRGGGPPQQPPRAHRQDDEMHHRWAGWTKQSSCNHRHFPHFRRRPQRPPGPGPAPPLPLLTGADCSAQGRAVFGPAFSASPGHVVDLEQVAHQAVERRPAQRSSVGPCRPAAFFRGALRSTPAAEPSCRYGAVSQIL